MRTSESNMSFIVNVRLISVVLVAALALSVCPGAPAQSAAASSNSGMCISIRDGYLGEKAFPTPIEGLRHLGLDAVELNLGRDYAVQPLDSKEKVLLLTDDDVKAFRKHVEELGVRVCAVETACDFSVGEPESNIAFVARAIEIADLLGAPAVRIDSAMSKERQLDFEARVKIFADGLGEALKRTANSKVAMGIENHGFQGNNLAFLLNVFQQVGSDRLGSTLDTGNFYWRGYPLSEVYGILRILAPYAKHTHIKNIRYPEDKREVTREAGWEYGKYSCPLDEGDLDVAKIVGMLAKAGYQGDLCIEDESVEKCATTAERVAVLERDVACVRKAMENAR